MVSLSVKQGIFSVVGAMALGVLAATPTQAIGFRFSQGGFDEGAFIKGRFLGEDLNGDGQISSFDGEVKEFKMKWSGNSLIKKFKVDLSGLNDFALVYDLNGPKLGDGVSDPIRSEGIAAFSKDFFYATGPGPFFNLVSQGVPVCNGTIVCGVIESANSSSFTTTTKLVKVVPTPALLPGLIGMGIATLRKKRAAAETES